MNLVDSDFDLSSSYLILFLRDYIYFLYYIVKDSKVVSFDTIIF